MAKEVVHDAQGQIHFAPKCKTCDQRKLWYRLPDGKLQASCYSCSPSHCIKCSARQDDKQQLFDEKCITCLKEERQPIAGARAAPQYILAPGMSLTEHQACSKCGNELWTHMDSLVQNPRLQPAEVKLSIQGKCICYLAEACHKCAKVVLQTDMFSLQYVGAAQLHLCDECIDDLEKASVEQRTPKRPKTLRRTSTFGPVSQNQE